MTANTDPVRAQDYVAVPRAFLEQVYAMAREGCEAPATAYRWCERIDGLFHGGSLDEHDEWARQLPAALASAPQPSFDRRFADMLIGILGDVQDELGFTDEEKLCANGSAEIVAAIRELKERALAPPPSVPPSAPVGVEDGPIDASDNAEYIEHCADRLERCGLRVTAGALRVIAHEHRALAQQPVAGEEIMVNAAHDVYTLPLQPSGLLSGPRFVVHVPAPEQQPAAPSGEAVAWVTRGSKRAHVRWFGAHEQSIPHGTKLYAAPQQPAGVDRDEVYRVAQHIGTAADYIDTAYPDANMLDRGPILRNMRRWHERLTAALSAQQRGGA